MVPEIDPSALIVNASALVERFGRWPDFHDAEIVHIELNRPRVARDLQIKLAARSREKDERGHFQLENVTLVTFQFIGVADLELGGFNHQNVIDDVHLEPAADRINVTIDPIYGLGGAFSCDQAEIIEIRSLANS